MPTWRDSDAWPDVIANIIPSIPILDGSKKVEANLKPVVESVGDFQGLVQLVVGGNRSVGAGGVASFGKVAVQFHHGVAFFHRLGAIHLNLVIVLGPRGERPTEPRHDQDSDSKLQTRLHA